MTTMPTTFGEWVFFLLQQYGGLFVKGAMVTLLLALVGTFIGCLIGFIVGIIQTIPVDPNTGAVKKSFYRVVRWLLDAYVEVFRGTPMIVQAMVVYDGSMSLFNIDMSAMFAGFLVVSINTGAYMSEIVRGGIFAVDKGQFEAATALGFTHNQTMRKIVLPQVVRNILPATGNEFVINIKDTSVLNVISVVELYFSGNTVATQTYQYFQTFTVIAIIYFILTFTVTRILRIVEKSFDMDKYTTGANQMQTGVLND